MLNKRKNNRGQTALEYALVVGVIAVGVVIAAQLVFGRGKDSAASHLFNTAVESAQNVVDASKTD